MKHPVSFQPFNESLSFLWTSLVVLNHMNRFAGGTSETFRRVRELFQRTEFQFPAMMYLARPSSFQPKHKVIYGFLFFFTFENSGMWFSFLKLFEGVHFQSLRVIVSEKVFIDDSEFQESLQQSRGLLPVSI